MAFELERHTHPDPDGPLSWARIPWDSDTFGLEFFDLHVDPERLDDARTALTSLCTTLDARGRGLMQCKIPVETTAVAATLCAAGFYPVETMLFLELPLERAQRLVERVPKSLALRDARAEDLDVLGPMAREAFHADRFHLDPHLSTEAAGARYEAWVRRGFEAGEPVFVFEDTRRSRTIGFFHVRETEPGVVDLSLAAVDPASRRLGLGSLMYQEVVQACRERGFRTAITHITVHNTDVFNLFARLGFAFRDPVVCLHRYHAG